MKVTKWVLVGLVALVVIVTAGTYAYIHFVEGDAPAEITLGGTASASPAAVPMSSAGITGTWRPTAGSLFGYRVKEVLNGQRQVAYGRTSSVTGSMTIAASTVKTVELSVDMASVMSNAERRDGQFRGRIMNVSQFPTATFRLTTPITLASVPQDTSIVTAKATGDLTLHGVTKSVTFDLSTRRNGDTIEVNGSLPVLFADYGIENPSFGTVHTEDHGILELLVVFARA